MNWLGTETMMNAKPRRFDDGSRTRLSLLVWPLSSVRVSKRPTPAAVLVLVVALFLGQPAFSNFSIRAAQTSNASEALKLFAEGQRLAELGTRTSVNQAIDKYNSAYELFKKDNVSMGLGIVRFAAGAAYSSLGQKRRALEAFLEASTYVKEMKDSSLYAISLAGIGIAYSNLSEWRSAIEFLDKARTLLQEEKSPEPLASVLCALGGTYIKLGKKQKGLEYVNSALSLAQEIHSKSLEINARLLMGAGLSSIGNKRKALDSIEQALKITKDQKDRSSEAAALLSLGEVHDSLGDKRGALRDYDEALRVGAEANDWTGKATVLNNMGSIYSDLGEIDRAITLYEESIKVSEADGEPEDAANPLNGLALIYDLRAEPLKALHYYQRALALLRAVKHQGHEAATLVNISRVYDSYNQHEQALKANNDAVASFRAVEDPNGEATAMANLGSIYNKLNRHKEAVDCLNRALELQRASENRGGQAHTLAKLGDAYRDGGELTKALDAYSESLAMMNSLEDRVGEAVVGNSLGFVYDLQRDYARASEYYLRALSLARSAGDLRGEATLLGNLGFLREKQEDLQQAEALYEQAVEARERIRAAARLDEFKIEVSGQSAELYSKAILLKIKSGKLGDAFELSERSRARTLLDQLNNVHIDFRKAGDPELVQQEQSLRFAMRALEEKLREERRNNPSSEAARSMAVSLRDQEDAYGSLLIRLKASNPDYAQLRSYSPVPLKRIQQFLEQRTTLISYFVTADKLLVFVVTSDALQAVEVPVKETQLRSAIDWFRDFASLRDAQPQALKQLHGWLIEPVQKYIRTAEVVIVPHGILHYVPFAALIDGRAYFGDEHSTSYLPSASILPSIRRRAARNGTPVLAVAQSRADGLPALRYADEEATTVAELYEAHALLTGKATRNEFLKRASACNVLHIAAHAELNARSPLFSRMLLSPDKGDNGAIEVREVYGMDLSTTDLVVLSACQTVLGAQSKGDDVVGLNRAFIYAGASSVIASLWTVDDEATSYLMKAFYVNLKKGVSKAAALQAAQSATRKKYPHPYYWASFVLTGDSGNE